MLKRLIRKIIREEVSIANDILVQSLVKRELEKQRRIKLRYKKLSDKAVTPTYAKYDDAGLDLTAVRHYSEFDEGHGRVIVYEFDLAFEIPVGKVGLLFPRSSCSKKPLMMANSVGVVDSGFRGGVKVKFKPTNWDTTENYEDGDKVAQLVIMDKYVAELLECEELSQTERGTGGYGHTGN